MSRLVLEGLQSQGAREEVVYRINVDPPAVSVASIVVTDVTVGDNVTSTAMQGSATVDSGAIVLPPLKGLTAGHTYEVAVLYADGNGSKLEPLVRVHCA